MTRRRRWITLIASSLALMVIAALFTPELEASPAEPAGRAPFVWAQDDLWRALEREHDRARDEGCTMQPIEEGLARVDAELELLGAGPRAPHDPVFDRLERALFDVAPKISACPEHLPALVARTTALRTAVKDQSAGWDLDDGEARDTLYRLLYGARAALEEVILQAPNGAAPDVIGGVDEPSETPSVVIEGVRVHSGDILLSRGGAPTSAFIARGNDYPGNFSHVALLHVAEDGEPTVIESHIEVGVVTSTAREYLEDTKLRIAVLRVRADHPALRADPLLPHRAATEAMEAARAGHIPYDFGMDWHDPSSQFCSEVAYAAYRARGVRLWRSLSSMSSDGLTRWLGAFGVRHFVTLAPSDLEHDPQLRVVAEWRNPDTLFADHVDNAVVDAMLEEAERGARVDYEYLFLPVARAMKGYSTIANTLGEVGPIPEGMSATTALRVDWLRARHEAIRAGVERRVRVYRRERGRRPPYWTLTQLARDAHADLE